MILVLDNYDSFTYNLVQYLGELGADVEVVRNDAMTLDAIALARPERIVISPGKTSTIDHDGRGVFSGLAGPFVASRYHSLIVSDQGLPAELEISARTQEDGAIMGLRHRVWPVHGVQFHPESILTGEGRHILRNFLEGRADQACSR
jgi:anthranilate/para-aminobenzoate synthase component II